MPIHTITLKNAVKEFNNGQTKVSILNNSSFEFKRGVSYAISGISGSGKSTLLHILAGLEPLTTGKIYIGDTQWNSLSGDQQAHVRQHSLGIIFQKPYLITELTVIENIMIKGLIDNYSMAFCVARAHELLELVDLQEQKHLAIYQLSGGQQQRVSIARALFNPPDFIIADEPTGHLDVVNAQRIVTVLKRCMVTMHCGLIISTHDMQVAQEMDEHFTLQNGSLQKYAPLKDEHVYKKIYY